MIRRVFVYLGGPGVKQKDRWPLVPPGWYAPGTYTSGQICNVRVGAARWFPRSATKTEQLVECSWPRGRRVCMRQTNARGTHTAAAVGQRLLKREDLRDARQQRSPRTRSFCYHSFDLHTKEIALVLKNTKHSTGTFPNFFLLW